MSQAGQTAMGPNGTNEHARRFGAPQSSNDLAFALHRAHWSVHDFAGQLRHVEGWKPYGAVAHWTARLGELQRELFEISTRYFNGEPVGEHSVLEACERIGRAVAEARQAVQASKRVDPPKDPQ